MADASAPPGKRKEGEPPAAAQEKKKGRWDAGAAPAPAQANGAPAAPGAVPQAKPGLVSLDALAKAKRALQMQKELNEKLKKLPQLQKATSAAAPAASASAPAPSLAASTPILHPTAAAVAAAAAAAKAAAAAVAAKAGIAGAGVGHPGVPLAAAGVPPTAASIAAAAAAAGLPVNLPGMPGGLPGPLQPPHLAAPGLLPVPGGGPGVPGLHLGALAPALGGAALEALGSGAGAGAGAGVSKAASTRAPVLRLDAFGREVDEEGNVVERGKMGPVSTLKVNINKQKKEAFKILHPELEPDNEDSPFYDPRMHSARRKLARQRKPTFNFVEEGKLAKQAEIMRLRAHFGEAREREAKAKAEALAREAEAAAAGGEEANPNMIAVGARGPTPQEERRKEPIPNVEWWDALLLVHPTSYYGPNESPEEGIRDPEARAKLCLANLKEGKITLYVEHPVPIEPPAEAPAPPPQPLRLTRAERKKLRTQKRVAREKERQEMVRQGLLEAPKAKVKMSNLMKVLASEATQDPTKMEKEVRAAAAEREQAHVDRNLARMLTPAERKGKKERKLFEDGLVGTGGETFVAVFKVGHLRHPQTRYKVDVNAQENRLTGCAVLGDEFSLVLVEGVQKSIKRYTRLMTHRIDWASAQPARQKGAEGEEEDEDEEEGPANWCKTVWQGAVAQAAFEKFTIEQCRNAAGARKFLQDKGVAHYWDAALTFQED